MSESSTRRGRYVQQLEGRLRRAKRRVRDARVGRLHAGRLLRPQVSVILPFYNVEQYVAECLDSILEQESVLFEVCLLYTSDAADE